MRLKRFPWTAEKKVLRVAQDDTRVCHPEGFLPPEGSGVGLGANPDSSLTLRMTGESRSFALLRTTAGCHPEEPQATKDLVVSF